MGPGALPGPIPLCDLLRSHRVAGAASAWRINMQLAIEVVLAIVLHPVAVVLAWMNIAGRRDLSLSRKLLWGVICLVWGIGPILYILLGDGSLW